jgi:hypothetical protein
MRKILVFLCWGVVLFNQSLAAGASKQTVSGDWTGAAAFALAEIRIGDDTILVADKGLSAPAVKALKNIRRMISVDDLPEQDDYSIPPGPFLVVRTFELHDGIYELSTRSGTIRKGVMGNCGSTITIRMKNVKRTGWERVGSPMTMEC